MSAMASTDLFASNFFLCALVAGGVYFVYAIHWELTTGAARRKLIAHHGCKSPRYENPHDFLGLQQYREVRLRARTHTILESGPPRFARLGNTFKFHILRRSVIMTIEPDILKAIMSTDFNNWGVGPQRLNTFGPFLGNGIFVTDGKAWQHSREMLRPNFHRKQVADRSTFEKHVNNLLDMIPRDGSTLDLQDLFFRLTMDSATEFLFGESCGTLKPGLTSVSHTHFADAFMRGQDTIGQHARVGSKLPILGKLAQLRADTKFVHDFVDVYVRKGREHRAMTKSDPEKATSDLEDGGRYIFLNELCKQTDDPIQIRAELLNILLAGRDTTASLLSNAWHVLANRPDIWARLKAEVDELNGEQPTFEQIKDMKYLGAFFKESLRLHPVVPGNARTALADTVLPTGGGEDGKSPIFCAKGTVVAWSVWSMHRRQDYYGADSYDFKPERWLGASGLRPGWEYLPFNGGPRICIGQQFALTEASYTTIRLIQAFGRVESRDPEPWTEWLTLTLASENGCKVALTPRKAR